MKKYYKKINVTKEIAIDYLNNLLEMYDDFRQYDAQMITEIIKMIKKDVQ